jgi:hypothetical protein
MDSLVYFRLLLFFPRERILKVASTNRANDLDAAILRRFQCKIKVELPNVSEREAMFRANLAHSVPAASIGASPCGWRRFALLSDGFSGADIARVVKDALMAPIVELQQATHVARVADLRRAVQQRRAQKCAASEANVCTKSDDIELNNVEEKENQEEWVEQQEEKRHSTAARIEGELVDVALGSDAQCAREKDASSGTECTSSTSKRFKANAGEEAHTESAAATKTQCTIESDSIVALANEDCDSVGGERYEEYECKDECGDDIYVPVSDEQLILQHPLLIVDVARAIQSQSIQRSQLRPRAVTARDVVHSLLAFKREKEIVVQEL